MVARVAVLLSLAAASAHADPAPAVRPQLAITPELVSRLARDNPPVPVDRVQLGARPMRLAIARRGLDTSLALVVDRASDAVGKLIGLRDGLGGFMRVENLTSSGPAAPRSVVLGFRLGMQPSTTGWSLTDPSPSATDLGR
jgi:hypothetical protein